MFGTGVPGTSDDDDDDDIVVAVVVVVPLALPPLMLPMLPKEII